jgi:protein TonB
MVPSALIRTALVRGVLGVILAFAFTSAAQTATPGEPPAEPIKMDKGVSAPKVISTRRAELTEVPGKAQKEGKVVLWIVVQADGTVGDVKVKHSLDKAVDEKAIEAVKQWRFEPARKNGHPVAARMAVNMNFYRAGGSGAPGQTETLPGSSIQTFKDGSRVFVNSSMGLRIALPPGWVQVADRPATYSRPASIVLNRKETYAALELVRQVVEASPGLYRKMFQQGLELTQQTFNIVGEESLSKADWNGVRLLVSGTRNDVKQQCIIDLYSREKQHYVLDACAPDEVFAKYRQEFDAMLKSVEFTGDVTEGVPVAK